MTVDDVLKDIFDQTPLPPELKSAKFRWQRNYLKLNAKKAIIEKYTNYIVEIVIVTPDKK